MAVGNNSQTRKRSRGMFGFKQHLLDIYDRTHYIIRTRSSQFRDFQLPMNPRELHHNYDLMMNDVIQGELEQTSYLKSIIEMMEINEYKLESVVSFIEFIKRSADYNVASLYNIIKVLCAFELKPEIQDMILQGLTAYLMISCNKQYGLLSKFILDINMICPKGQFLHQLTSDIAKSLSLDLKNGGLWKEKPLHWPPEWPFYDPRNKPKDQGYDTGTDNKLLKCLEEHCHSKGLFNITSKFDDEQTQFKVEQYQKEITAWKYNRTELFELYTLRQELVTLRAAKESLHKYMKDSELHQGISDLNVDFNFDTDNVTAISSEGYTDTVRDIAITFCRIGKGLSPLEKSDGIWKTPPSGWTPNDSYFSPCNAGKRKEKGQDQKLVDNLLTYCESKNKAIPAELQPLLKAWKLRNTSEITKSYTIWSKTAIIKHSLQYLQLEGLLEKINVQESLKQIGVILDMQHWRCPSINKSCTKDNDDKSKDLHSSSSSDIETNSTASIQINSDNPCTQLSNSTQPNSKDTPASPASPHSLVSHTDGHLCNTASDQPNQLNQSSKHTRVNSFKDSCPILTSKTQPEADGNHQPISTVNSSTSKGEVIPCTVHIHDATPKTDSNNKFSKTAKKRGKQKNDESPTEPKRLHISEEDDPLTKDCSKDGDIIYIVPNQFPHDLISIQSRLNPLATKKQTDQLVVKDLTDIASDKAKDSSLSNRKDGEINKANKNKTTSDQYVDKIVDLLEELDQDYSSTVLEGTIPISCSSTDQSSDSSDEFPELCVDTYLNSYNPDDTLETDIEQFIEEQGMDSG
ncbi:unnamed protein product [Mytilus edulis]|uniref:Uncharacterized protein n=1 Tax=Mytilus edulis TaxID=6550 RepID=A0A8S3RGN2_MYTED|nr:unnamed protein product [Mytilus edulis]